MLIDLGTIRPGRTLRIPFSTFDKDDGSTITMTNYAVADILIYKDGNTTARASTSGFTATTDFSSKTGKHLLIIDLADNATADFFQAGSEYEVGIDAVTVDGVTVGGWVARFEIGYPGAIIDTTIATLAGQTSFTLTSGPGEDDALNGMTAIIHDAASAVQLSRVLIIDYTGSTKTVTLAAGATFTAAAKDNISIFCGSASLPNALPGAIGGLPLDEDVNSILTTVNSGTHGNAALKTLIDTVDDLLDTEVAALTTELAKVPKSDGTASWNATALAAIQTEANDALVANHLDHLIGVADPGGVVANNSFLAKLVSKSATATFSDYVNTTDSLQAIRDNFPANFNGLVIDGSGVVSADVQEILGYSLGSGVVGDTSFIGANFEDFFFNNESSTSAKVGDISSILTDTAEIGAAGAGLTEAGGTGDHLTALATQASVNTIDDLLDTEVGALQTTLNALFTTALSESYRSAGAAPTMAQFAFETLAHLGDCSITSTTKTLNNLAGTAAKTFTLNSSSAPTSITEAT